MTRFYTNPRRVQAQACCDRCGFNFLHSDLRWQFEYAGAGLVNTRLLVCKACLDVPNPQLRSVAIAPDEVPIRDPRPDPTEGLIGNPLTTEDGTPIFTEVGSPIVTENGG